MNGMELIRDLFRNPLVTPRRVKLVLRTKTKISKSVFSGQIIRQKEMIGVIGFHLSPEKYTESDDPNYFHTPEWSRGNYPVFFHDKLQKTYLGVLPEKTLNDRFLLNGDEQQELPKDQVKAHMQPKGEEIAGYPIYFNVAAESIVDAEYLTE